MNFTVDQRKAMLRGESTYKELCFSCHGADGKGAPMQGAPPGTTLAPPLSGSARVLGHRDYVIKVLLHGLTGDLDGKAYGTAVMVPMGSNTDQWIADVASYVRNAFGNGAPFVTPDAGDGGAQDSQAPAAVDAGRADGDIPAPLTNTAEWKVTACQNDAAAANAAGATPGGRWDTGAPQAPGM